MIRSNQSTSVFYEISFVKRGNPDKINAGFFTNIYLRHGGFLFSGTISDNNIEIAKFQKFLISNEQTFWGIRDDIIRLYPDKSDNGNQYFSEVMRRFEIILDQILEEVLTRI